MIINPSDLSYEKLLEKLGDYVDSQTDGKWKDYFEGSTGTILLELLAGLGTYLAYQAVTSRREAYLSSARLRSSLIAIAQTLGYSVFRGKNTRVTVTVDPESTVSLSKFSIVGSYKDYDLVVLSDVALNQGETKQIELVVGNLKEESMTITDNGIFRFSGTDVTEDVLLLLDDSEVSTTTDYGDLLEDKWLVMSNYLSGVDVVYLGAVSGSHTLTLKYVQSCDVSEIDSSQLSFLYGTIQSIDSIIPKQSAESDTKIKISAPVHHDLQKVIRSREDYPKAVLSMIPDLVDTNAIDESAAVVKVTYLKSDKSLLSADDKTDLLNKLEKIRPFGIPLPTIVDPVEVSVTLDILLKLSDPSVSITTINNDIETVLSSYSMKLGVTIDLDQIEHDLEDYSYVKVARVTTATTADPTELAWNEYAEIQYNLTLKVV